MDHVVFGTAGHIDHGKTTLVDKLLSQSGTLGERAAAPERVMDSNVLERERGITILAKNTAIKWQDYRINIVDTPGHADFGGEVERVLSMVDSVLLLVDAVDGPMPQTRFVTQKALARGLHPIVVINKIDRPGARPAWVLDQTFDLFDRLGATDEQLDFPVVYASALNGYASLSDTVREGDMEPLFQTIADKVHPPQVELEDPFQLQVSQLDYNSYVGVIGIGRIARGRVRTNTPVTIVGHDGQRRSGRILQIFGFLGLERVEVPEASAGDIIAFTGIDKLYISDTLCDPNAVEALAPLTVDEPTVSMTFQVNNSPFAGKDGKFVTSRQIKERLERELLHNVALRVQETEDPDKFRVSGRGELHLSVLIENMRREGYELSVAKPEIVTREIDGLKHEPMEIVQVDCPEEYVGVVTQKLGGRRGQMTEMHNPGHGRVRLEFRVPSRALIGFRSEFLTDTRGTGILNHLFDGWAPWQGPIGGRPTGALISDRAGKATPYALFHLEPRGTLFIPAGTEVYEGMIVGIHSRSNALVVNPTNGKQLTNIRAAGSDREIKLAPPVRLSLEEALEHINLDEYVEVTPQSIRLRKILLSEHDRKREKKA